MPGYDQFPQEPEVPSSPKEDAQHLGATALPGASVKLPSGEEIDPGTSVIFPPKFEVAGGVVKDTDNQLFGHFIGKNIKSDRDSDVLVVPTQEMHGDVYPEGMVPLNAQELKASDLTRKSRFDKPE